MNTRPTPETDAMEIYDAMCDPDRVVASALARKLERERDEARFDLEFRRRLGDQQNETINELAHARDEARAEMIRWMSIAEGRGRTEDDDTGKAMAKLIRQRDEARGQRDRLAEALKNVIDEDGTPMSIDRADEALQTLTPKHSPTNKI